MLLYIMKYISIGPYCSSNVMIQKAGLRAEAYPFDNIFSSIEIIQKCIDDSFNIFLNKSYIVKVEKNTSTNTYLDHLLREPITIENRKQNRSDTHNIPIFLHHDLTDSTIYESYKRKCSRFMNILIDNTDLCFVFTINFISDNNIIMNYIEKLYNFKKYLIHKYSSSVMNKSILEIYMSSLDKTSSNDVSQSDVSTPGVNIEKRSKNIKIIVIQLLNKKTATQKIIDHDNLEYYIVESENDGIFLLKNISNHNNNIII